MKQTWTKRLLSLLMAAAITLGAVPAVLAQGTDNGNKAGGAPHGQVAPLNTDYLDYIKNGGSGSMPSTQDFSYLASSYRRQAMRRNTLLPKSYDLRNEGRASSVPNQGAYGTCWAFAALGSAESGLIEQFPGVSLSELHLAWFTYVGPEEEEFAWDVFRGEEPDPLNSGGNDGRAVGTMAAWKGPVFSETLPYDAEDVEESLRYAADYHLQDAYYLPNATYGYHDPEATYASRQTIQQILMEEGAVSISYTAGDQVSNYNEETYAVYNDTYSSSDHAVLIVGWDDDFPKESFREGERPENDGAWLIRNSWGTGWGDDGYFWLSYEDKTIDIGPYYNLESKDNYDNNYQYDTLGWGISAAADEFVDSDKASKTGYMSNIFTAKDAEQLEAVSFYTTDAGTKYEISVYTGVEEGKPTSGKLAFSGQSGTEPYAGYHTIELDRAVALEKGERFSVVVRLQNPSYAYPLPVEFCLLPLDKDEPAYMGSGGESYYSLDGKSWADITTMPIDNNPDAKAYTTNVCIKAFTNARTTAADVEPAGTVRFSLMEGPVALGSTLELSAPSAEEIWYTTDGSTPNFSSSKYTGPIVIDKGMTVKATARKDGIDGPTTTKTYTQAASQLLELTVEQAGTNVICDLSADDKTYTVLLNNQTEQVKIRPRGSDTIKVNGKTVASDSWSEGIAVGEGETKTVEVVSSADGKTSTTYTVKVRRSILRYDYTNETVSFGEGLYVTDQTNHPLKSGDSITPYLVDEGEEDVVLGVIRADDGAMLQEVVPQRRLAIASPIDFENERTFMAYGNTNDVADNPEMTNAVRWNGTPIPVEPGKDVYIRKFATDTDFASTVVKLDIPASRPAAPTPIVEDVGPIHISMKPVEGAQYRIADGEWQEAPVLKGLEMDTAYTVEMRLSATDTDFASEIVSVQVKTGKGVVIPVSYEYQGKVIFDSKFGAVSGKNTVTAQTEGIAEYGFVLENPESTAVEVTVIEKNGVLSADVETVVFPIRPTTDPAAVSFDVSYWDMDGNRVEGGGTQTFDSAGPLSRDSIPLPYGYQAVEPEEPSDSWEHPTGMYFSDGVWFAYPNRVRILVEKMASVVLEFKLEDGTVLETREQFYGEGAGLETVIAPEGYSIVGDNTFALDVTRDEDDNLVADPAKVSFTVKAAVVPSDYFFTVRYEDAAGNPVPGGGKQYFDAVGRVSREDIPLPYGYQELPPAHPDDDWLYPTALVCVDGVWQASNPEVVIQVEKQACVKIVFKTEDGTVLEDAGYEEYFGEIGAGMVSVQAPEGYEIVGDDSYAVDVTRDADGNLIADPAEISFVVKKTGTQQPSKPTTPAHPDDQDNPNTGDGGLPVLPLVVLMVISGSALAVTRGKRRIRS